ncbi:MAG: hypothetical protein UX78_C0007G0006 [Candidatus Amesbacteria bacterium GW2011_GWA2_47_11]|uniref:UvrABC system protein C n=1 Tax=Candidatus Amesbacteria bacterium GW2011_GWA2_47_11 TaxID=1618357 RepID=A0A0G1UFJ1_9BACT|nr:MAG: hypothetical protein UX78_C0007G0006 [Candidatus Amesbacteria bacterium GW2011_GWA2_47_11]
MLLCAKKMDFEAASLLRDRISALNQLRSTPVSADEYLANPNLVQDQRQQALNSLRSAINHEFITDNPLHRIEMYDVSHLRGQSATAAMTVAYDGYVNSRLYRHFTIKKAPSDNDVGMLTEVLDRRLRRTDWPPPDLIVLDGGRPQLSIIPSLKHITYNLPPIIALAKREETIIIPLSSGFKEIRLDRVKKRSLFRSQVVSKKSASTVLIPASAFSSISGTKPTASHAACTTNTALQARF